MAFSVDGKLPTNDNDNVTWREPRARTGSERLLSEPERQASVLRTSEADDGTSRGEQAQYRPVIWYIFPPIGGPGLGRYWRGYNLARAWQRAGARPVLIGPGFHHYFHSPQALSGCHQIEGVTYHFVPTRPYGSGTVERVRAFTTFGLRLLADRELADRGTLEPPDVVIYSSPYPFGYPAGLRLARRYRAGMIFEVRDIWPLSLTELLGTSRWHPFILAAGACERYAYITADRVVSLLPNAAEHMIERGMSWRKFAYIPNGADVDPLAPRSPDPQTPLLSRARALSEQGCFVIAHVGNMSVTTNLALLLQAAGSIQEQGRHDIRVLLVGRGELEEVLKQQARDDRLANVEFFPQVDKSEIATLLPMCHAGFAALQPKPIYRFGYSLNKLFDYMVAGLPVVLACDFPGAIEQARAGVRVSADKPGELASAICRLADLPAAERAGMGERGRLFVKTEHNYDVLGRKYLDLFAAIRPGPFARYAGQ